MTFLLIICAFLAFFFSTLVFLKKNKIVPDYLLGYWLLFTALHMLILYIQFYNAKNNYPFPGIIGIDISLVAVHPIWIFLYILSYVQTETRIYRVLWHVIPFIVLNLILLKTFYLRSNAEKIISFQSALNGTGYIDSELELSVLLVISTALAYLLASYWLLRKHMKNVKNHFSTLEGVDLKWLRVLLYWIAIAVIINSISDLTRNYLNLLPPLVTINIGYIAILAGISFVGVHGIRQTKIFTDNEDIASEIKIPSYKISAKKPEQPPEPDQNIELDKDYEMLIQYIEENKPYLDIDLDLLALADQVGFKSRYLSQLINKKYGKSFFDFVNYYRIQEFKNRIRQPENKNFTIISIAFDCGFNSKATFNRVFKNQTGYTPSDYFKDPSLG